MTAGEIERLRGAVVAEALAWRGTRWHHRGRMKGIGVDCAQFLALVYEAVGLVAPIPVQHYPVDWHLSRDEPRFLAEVRQHAVELAVPDEALPGDVAMFRYGRHAAHGAIVVRWPVVIHAYVAERSVVESDLAADVSLHARLDSVWRLRAFVEA